MRWRARTVLAAFVVFSVYYTVLLIAQTSQIRGDDDDGEPALLQAAEKDLNQQHQRQRLNDPSTSAPNTSSKPRLHMSPISVALVLNQVCTDTVLALVQLTAHSLSGTTVPPQQQISIDVLVSNATDACAAFLATWDWPHGPKHVVLLVRASAFAISTFLDPRTAPRGWRHRELAACMAARAARPT